MTRGTWTAAMLAGVSTVCATVALCVTGHAPEFLVMLATATAGGFLGMTPPGPKP